MTDTNYKEDEKDENILVQCQMQILEYKEKIDGLEIDIRNK